MSAKQRIVGWGIFVFWLVMTGWLLSRELGVRRIEPGRAAVDLEEPRESWMAVKVLGEEEQTVGRIHFASRPEERQGLAGHRFDLGARMRLQLLGKATDLELDGEVWRPVESPRLELLFTVRSAEHHFEIEGVVADGEMRGKVTSAGEVLPLEFPVGSELLLDSGLGAALRFPVLEVGEQYEMDSFDPLTLSKGTARVRCVAREVLKLEEGSVETLRLEVESGGFESLAWVDEHGEVVRAETPVGLVIERLPGPPPEALAERAVGGDDLLALTAVRPSGPRPYRGAQELVLALGGIEGLEPPSDGTQQALGDGRFRIRPGAALAEPAPVDAAEHLGSDAFIQTDHPRIIERAWQIVGGEEDPRARALAIQEWVFTRIDKEAVLSLPSALEILEQRRGDCNEHTVLYTALARAAGIPTRIAIGLVWSDELDGFYYHAWPEVLLDGSWLWLDPTLGQAPADATHLKLLNGGIERWPRLVPYLGRLEIEVLELH
jgi:hypothetical protein